MVPQDRLGPELAAEADAAGGVRAAVHEVADGVQGVRRGVVADGLQEVLELLPASLEVPDEDAAAGHGARVGPGGPRITAPRPIGVYGQGRGQYALALESRGPLPRRPRSITMAKSQTKAGGPTRGRKRVRKIGMGSGKYIAARKAERKGVGPKKKS